MKTKKNLQGVSTFRWDTTYTTTYKIINESIRKYSTSPTAFSNHEKPVTLKRAFANGRFLKYPVMHNLFSAVSENASVFLEGEWKQWSLELLGNGNVIFMRLPVKSGNIELPGFGKGTLSDGYIVADIRLQIIGTDTKSIILGSKPIMEVSIHEHNFPHIEKGSVMDMLIDGTFKEYLNSEDVITQFKQVFATASINDKATGDFAWLTPSDLSYAVFAPDYKATENNCLYSMLCMTDNDKAPLDIQKSVDSEVFNGKTEGTNAVLCISPQKFSEHVLIEASKNLILGSQESDYAYSTDGMEIHNIHEIIMKNVEINDGKKVDLKIAVGNYTIRIMNDHLETFITNATFHASLYDAYITFNQKIRFETQKSGDNTIFIPKEGDYYNAVTHVEIEPTELAEILQWVGVGIDILSAILCVAGGVVAKMAKVTTTSTKVAVEAETVAIAAEAAVVSDVAAAISQGTTKGVSIANALLIGGSVGTAIGLGFSLTSTIATAIAKKDYSKIPTLESFAVNLLSKLKWTGVKDAELLGARLNDAFLLDYKVKVE